VKFELIENWSSVWRYWSVWAMVILGMLPEIVDVLVQYQLVPAADTTGALSKLAKAVMVGGILLRMVQQKKLAMDAAAPPPSADGK
jgi:hypothetical protein